MNLRMNAGYIITDSVHVDEMEFVLGVHSTASKQFVTWACKDGNNYFWGHYFNDLMAATKDLIYRAEQEELNRLYDNFSRKFGLINDKTNERAFSDDSSYYLLCALEILDDDGKFVRKADMFTKRTILPRQEITHVDTATEALEVSIGERARVDIPFMAGLTGKTEEDIINELQGQIFRVPFREPPLYQTADEYLSGNVRKKLKVAEVAAESDPAFNINVNALAAIQPKDLDASEISVRLGTDWIDPEYVEQFMYELLKTPGYAREYTGTSPQPRQSAGKMPTSTSDCPQKTCHLRHSSAG